MGRYDPLFIIEIALPPGYQEQLGLCAGKEFLQGSYPHQNPPSKCVCVCLCVDTCD